MNRSQQLESMIHAAQDDVDADMSRVQQAHRQFDSSFRGTQAEAGQEHELRWALGLQGEDEPPTMFATQGLIPHATQVRALLESCCIALVIVSSVSMSSKLLGFDSLLLWHRCLEPRMVVN